MCVDGGKGVGLCVWSFLPKRNSGPFRRENVPSEKVSEIFKTK